MYRGDLLGYLFVRSHYVLIPNDLEEEILGYYAGEPTGPIALLRTSGYPCELPWGSSVVVTKSRNRLYALPIRRGKRSAGSRATPGSIRAWR